MKKMTHKLDPGTWRLLTLSPVLGMYALLTGPRVGTIFKDAALRQLCVAEAAWTGYVTEPH